MCKSNLKNLSILFILSILFTQFSCVITKKQVATQSRDMNLESVKKEERLVVNAINGKYSLIDTSSIQTFLLVNFSHIKSGINLKDLDKIFNIQWAIVPEYGIKEKLKSGRIEFNDQHLKQNGDSYELNFKVEKPKGVYGGVLIVDFIDVETSVKYTYDLPVDFTGKRFDTRYLMYDAADATFPSFKNYRTENVPFYIKGFVKEEMPVFLIKYNNKTSPALSPMSNSKRDENSELEMLDKQQIDISKPLSLSDIGTYVFSQQPDNHIDGMGFLVANQRYPRSTEANTLLQSVKYMSTPKEIDLIKTTQESKEAMDMYFLTITKGDEALSKKIIKNYYQRVSEANKLFTSYKEGWKSDKGMVYIIMGPPNKVQRNRQREIWQYSQNQNNSDIIFTFNKKSNKFSDSNYELIRYPEYSSFWYPYVESWRKGSVQE